jgi:hypothetical protein
MQRAKTSRQSCWSSLGFSTAINSVLGGSYEKSMFVKLPKFGVKLLEFIDNLLTPLERISAGLFDTSPSAIDVTKLVVRN